MFVYRTEPIESKKTNDVREIEEACWSEVLQWTREPISTVGRKDFRKEHRWFIW